MELCKTKNGDIIFHGGRIHCLMYYVSVDINMFHQSSILVFEDNQSTIKMITNDQISRRTKHVDIKYQYIKDYYNVVKSVVNCNLGASIKKINSEY